MGATRNSQPGICRVHFIVLKTVFFILFALFSQSASAAITNSKENSKKNNRYVKLSSKPSDISKSRPNLLGQARKHTGSGSPFWSPACVGGPEDKMGLMDYCQQLAGGFGYFVSKFTDTIVAAKQHLIAGAAARGVSIFAMYPLDTIKTRLQVEASKVIKPAEGASLFSKVAALYKGCPESLFGQIPYGMLTFGSYEVYKELLAKNFPQIPKTLTYFISAIFGDITGSFWLVPSEIVKLKMQSGGQSSLFNCLGGIWKESGFGGFYRGYTGQIARDVPFRAIQLTTYETIKTLYCRYRAGKRRSKGLEDLSEEDSLKLSGLEGAVLGAIAGSFSAGVTTPLDVIKTRMMTAATSTTVWQISQDIVKNEGLGGLLHGLGPRVIYVGPSVAIFFMTYEIVKNIIVDGDLRLAQQQQRQQNNRIESKSKLVTLNSKQKRI
mmetsp:Transcript_229/g.440  ORF Transcript_229/g.440 Transcript_229/m.440 type:complete len:437 (-) Transcript_229:347-1657(-)